MSASEFVPEICQIDELREAAAECRGCDLYRHATQTVFGEGPRKASLMLIGEQPGDREDETGRPFVGPAGRLLDDALDAAGTDRSNVYVTNAVKHFKWQQRGKRRLHKKPSAREISACRPWLDAEFAAVGPAVVVCLGATAAQQIFGRDFRITRQRGEWQPSGVATRCMATWHPSAVLRTPDQTARRRMRDELVRDLRRAVHALS